MTTTDRLETLAQSITPWGFPALYLGWAYLFWTPIFGSETSVWEGTNLLLFLVGGASPLLVGLTMGWLTGGTERVRDLGRRLVDVGRISAKWWLVILVFWPLFNLVTAGAAIALGVTDRPISVVWAILTEPATLGFMLAVGLLFPAIEEIGLRGYYLDRLQERFSPVVAGIINGSTWAAWHAAFVFFPGYYANTSYDPELWWWMPSIVLHTLIFVWVYNNTERSILAVLFIHSSMNLTGEFLGLADEMFSFQLPVLALVVTLLILSGRLSHAAVVPESPADGDREFV
ncbi:CPBP family intramembrane glutamic endopeptidase [Haloferax sulfurifontis]|uniref:Abortive infection protein-like protein n=1 Tax=Haloferax sulfurifontis ATCC BAA-897 TaxID=662480 RepID=M0HUY9_9EURY|nr:CPBP family intramembrane glutamic endopeptidase [Haloferax sulfurifontis]ELZ88316.1 abortive infection protein-like protein [Haloferax sulfurifontis ATCC BAA-897]